MSPITLIILLIVVAFSLWMVNTYTPDPGPRKIFTYGIIALVLLILLLLILPLGNLGDIRIG